jgi:hypothetical protein
MFQEIMASAAKILRIALASSEKLPYKRGAGVVDSLWNLPANLEAVGRK